MRRLLIPLIGGAMFVYGLVQIINMSSIALWFTVMMGALLLSVEMSRW